MARLNGNEVSRKFSEIEQGLNYLKLSASTSSGEVRSQAYRALDWGYISEEERQQLDKLAWRTGAAIQGLLDYLNSTDIKGQRFIKGQRLTKSSNIKFDIPPSNDDAGFPTEPPPSLK